MAQLLDEDPQYADTTALGLQAQASAEQATTYWPEAPDGAPLPADFVSGQVRAEAGMGQETSSTPFQALADFGSGLPAGSSNGGQVFGSSVAVNGSSGNEVDRTHAAYQSGVPHQAPSVPGHYAPFAGSSQ